MQNNVRYFLISTKFTNYILCVNMSEIFILFSFHRQYQDDVSFHTFPKNIILKKKWEHALKMNIINGLQAFQIIKTIKIIDEVFCVH